MTFKQFYLLGLFGITFSIASYLYLLWYSHSKKSRQNIQFKHINQGLLFVIFAKMKMWYYKFPITQSIKDLLAFCSQKNDRYYKSYFIDFGDSYYKKDKKTSSLKEL